MIQLGDQPEFQRRKKQDRKCIFIPQEMKFNWSNHMKKVKTEHGGLLDSQDKRKDWTDDLVT